jgi:hypothetical protein
MADRPRDGKKVLVVGDVFVDVLAGPLDRLPRWGKDTYSPHAIEALAGGSAQNTASGLGSLGVSTTLFSAVGADAFADVVRKRLVDRGVAFQVAANIPGDLPTGTCIVLVGEGDRGFVSHYGVADEWSLDELSAHYLTQFDHVHVGGYFSCRGMRDSLPAFLARCCTAQCTTSIDTNDDWTSEWDPHFVANVRRQPRVASPSSSSSFPQSRSVGLLLRCGGWSRGATLYSSFLAGFFLVSLLSVACPHTVPSHVSAAGVCRCGHAFALRRFCQKWTFISQTTGKL